MRKTMALLIALTALLVGGRAGAHQGGTHARGTVKEITADRIVLTTTEGASVTVAIVPRTRIIRGHRAIRPADVRPGERAVVHAASHDGKVEAVEVMVAEGTR